MMSATPVCWNWKFSRWLPTGLHDLLAKPIRRSLKALTRRAGEPWQTVSAGRLSVSNRREYLADRGSTATAKSQSP